MTGFTLPLDLFEDEFAADLRVSVVNLHLDLYCRVLQSFHGNVIVDLRRGEEVVLCVDPLEGCLVQLLFEESYQSFRSLALLRNVVVCDEFELREESALLLAGELQLHIFEAHTHRLVLLDIEVELDAAECLASLDVSNFEVVALRPQSHCEELKRDVGDGFVLTAVPAKSLLKSIKEYYYNKVLAAHLNLVCLKVEVVVALVLAATST